MVLEGEGEKGEEKADSQFSRAGQSSLFPFSENNMPGNNKTQFQLELPVKYAVYMVVTRYWLPGLSALPSPLGWTWRIEHLRASLCACASVCLQLCVHTCAFVCVWGANWHMMRAPQHSPCTPSCSHSLSCISHVPVHPLIPLAGDPLPGLP